MNLMTAPYDPQAVKVYEDEPRYDSLYVESISIQTPKMHVSAGAFVLPITILVASIGFAMLWGPLFMALNALTILLWILRPSSRIIQPVRIRERTQKGKRSYKVRYAPYVDWDLYKHNEFYRSAVVEWFDAVRASGNISVKRTDWQRYLGEMEIIANNSTQLSPDFHKLNALKEVMK